MSAQTKNLHLRTVALVLAAGRGSRFASESGEPLPKVLRPVLGRPMVCHVLDTLDDAGVEHVVVVVGFGAEAVKNAVGEGVRYVTQPEQKGSGHAAACAREAFAGFDGQLVVMCGDSPLFTCATLAAMMAEHASLEAAVTLAAAVLDDPTGYGRILRDRSGGVSGIAEERCASAEQKALREVNGGAYVFDCRWLFDNIDKMVVNEAGEYNLTDMVRVAIEQGRVVASVRCDPTELMGVNTAAQLREVEEVLRRRDTQ